MYGLSVRVHPEASPTRAVSSHMEEDHATRWNRLPRDDVPVNYDAVLCDEEEERLHQQYLVPREPHR